MENGAGSQAARLTTAIFAILFVAGCGGDVKTASPRTASPTQILDEAWDRCAMADHAADLSLFSANVASADELLRDLIKPSDLPANAIQESRVIVCTFKRESTDGPLPSPSLTTCPDGDLVEVGMSWAPVDYVLSTDDALLPVTMRPPNDAGPLCPS
jgi:hypothetical protein